MRALFYARRFAYTLLALVAVTQGAIAAGVPTKSGHVRYTSGTADGRAEGVATVADRLSAPALRQDLGPWQVASLDASLVGGQSVPIGIKQATFEVPSASRFDPGSLTVAKSATVVDATRDREPGFWATALSTLALGLFFFMRRLA